MREDIVRRVRVHLSKSKAAGRIASEEHELATLVYCHEISPEHRSVIARLPEEYFQRQNRIAAVVIAESGARHPSICLALAKGTFALPLYLTGWSASVEVKSGTKLANRLVSFAIGRDTFAERQRKITEDVKKTLVSVSTEAKLIEIWPEAVEYLLPPEEKPKHPPVPVLDLKKQISELET